MQEVRTSLRQLIGTLVLGTDNSSRLVLHLFSALVGQYLSTWHGPRPFIVGRWYKPPNSPQDIFRQFESLIDKVDSEQKEFYLLGDLNCNMHDGSNHSSSTLTNILDIYGLGQLISESTRITLTSSTLIDLQITDDVVHLGISNHSLVFITLKICD